VPIKENRLLRIENKIITIQDLYNLGEILISEFDSLSPSSKKKNQVSFEVKCFDPTSFVSSELDIFESQSPILKKRVKSILMTYSSASGRRISVTIVHGNTSQTQNVVSEIQVEGDDSYWISGMFDKFINTLNTIQNQKSWILENKRAIYWVAFIVGFIVSGQVWDFFSDLNQGTFWKIATESIENFIILGLFISILFGAIPSFFFTFLFMEYLHKVWPSVEIQVGPEHLHLEKRKRKIFIQVLTLFILPLLISLVVALII